ncbi:hypothetical protein A9Q99_19365 [Gammaproteobacteria bacterium 45_16_T64]|nr:hypothetical protein A9Q99_19365 [Gammaproteobacteria bacterium 45_16_T64]
MHAIERRNTAKYRLLRICIAIVGALSASNGWAVLTENIAIGSPRALSLANAVTADPPGIDSIHFNPAGLSRVEGRQQAIKFIYGNFDIGLDFGKRTETRQALLDQAVQIGSDLGAEYPEGFFEDEAYMQSSSTEGVSMIIPGSGMMDLAVPLSIVGGTSYQPPGGNITFGTNVYTPMAAGFYRADDDPGRFIGQRFSTMVLTYFSPTVAIEVTDTLSVGATLTFNYGGVGLDLPLRVPHLAHLVIPTLQLTNCGIETPLINICEDLPLYDQLGELNFSVEQALAFGYNFGLLWEVTPWLSLGMVYQSPIDMHMEGEFSWENSDAWVQFIAPLREGGLTSVALDVVGIEGEKYVEGDADLELTMPEHMSFGVSLQLLPSLRVNIDYKFTGWSKWDELSVKLSEVTDLMAIASFGETDTKEGVSLVLPLGMEDTWNFAYGIEYQYNDQLVLRMGVEDRPSSIPEVSMSPFLPLGDSTLYGIGFGYETVTGTLYEVGMSYFESQVSMPGNTSDFGNSEDPTKLIYNPYPGQDIDASTTIIMLEIGFHREF